MKKIKEIILSPTLRPIEIWLIRAAILAIAAKLGIDLSH